MIKRTRALQQGPVARAARAAAPINLVENALAVHRLIARGNENEELLFKAYDETS